MEDLYKRCPECGASWKGEGIYKGYMTFEWFRKLSRRERVAWIKARYTKPYYMSRVTMKWEDDGTTYGCCPDCNYKFKTSGVV